MAVASFDPQGTPIRFLPPWELAKAYAFSVAVAKISEHTGMKASELLGCRVDKFVAEQVYLANGKHPEERAVRKAIQRCTDPAWYPGKQAGARSGRPPVYSDHIKNEVARVGMDIKRKLLAPTPRRVRARLPELTKNPSTGKPMDDKTVHKIFSSMCYDLTEDDPWQYLENVAQDVLPSEMLPLRLNCAKHILKTFNAGSWYTFVSIDPCYTLLAKKLEMKEEQMVAAMGKKKWRSPGAPRTGPNARAPSTTNKQTNSWFTRVDWTVVFARDKLRIFVVDEKEADRNPEYPKSLADSDNLAKFMKNVLPGILAEMQDEYGWATMPRIVVHDKASYMVTHAHHRLNAKFAEALSKAGFTSWVGGNHATTSWLAKKWGDVYIHETVIANVRRLLDSDFMCTRLCETPAQFRSRMKRVEEFMNSPGFARADGGRGLAGLARELLERCERVKQEKGGRIPK